MSQQDDHELSRQVAQAAARSPYATARVADGYGVDPHEHKPSQDAFDPDGEQDTEAAQAETGGVVPCPGTSSSPSESSDDSSSKTSGKSDSSPVPTTANRTAPDRTGSSTARTTGTGHKNK